jgi:hypothetical protein
MSGGLPFFGDSGTRIALIGGEPTPVQTMKPIPAIHLLSATFAAGDHQRVGVLKQGFDS